MLSAGAATVVVATLEPELTAVVKVLSLLELSEQATKLVAIAATANAFKSFS